MTGFQIRGLRLGFVIISVALIGLILYGVTIEFGRARFMAVDASVIDASIQKFDDSDGGTRHDLYLTIRWTHDEREFEKRDFAYFGSYTEASVAAMKSHLLESRKLPGYINAKRPQTFEVIKVRWLQIANYGYALVFIFLGLFKLFKTWRTAPVSRRAFFAVYGFYLGGTLTAFGIYSFTAMRIVELRLFGVDGLLYSNLVILFACYFVGLMLHTLSWLHLHDFDELGMLPYSTQSSL